MQVQFNQPVTIGKNTYGKGQHAVPDLDVKDNWFFDALVKDGSAVVLRHADAPESVSEVIPVDHTDVPDLKPAGKKAK